MKASEKKRSNTPRGEKDGKKEKKEKKDKKGKKEKKNAKDRKAKRHPSIHCSASSFVHSVRQCVCAEAQAESPRSLTDPEVPLRVLLGGEGGQKLSEETSSQGDGGAHAHAHTRTHTHARTH